MPFIHVQHLAGSFTKEQQQTLINEITEVFVRQGGEGIRPAVNVAITEVASGLWGVGGHALTTEEIERRRAARKAAGGS